MGCVQSYFRKAHNAGLSPSSTHGSVKAGIPQDPTDDVADLVNQPEKEPLDVTDIQNEDEVNLTEKPNESAPELNGTVKTEDGDAGKLISIVTGISAATAAAATVAAEKLNSEEKQELSEDGEVVTQSGITSVSASPAPALSDADTADVTEVSDVKSPLSVKLGDEAVVVEAASIKSDTASEAEEKRSVSIPITQDTAKSNEEVPREPVPDDKLSTAISEDIPAQSSRPTSASQISVNEEEGGSEPINATVDGTIPNSASSVKLESVPEQEQDAESRRLPTFKEPSSNRSPSSSEQGTESQNDNRPFSVTASNKETSRPTSSISLSKENADTVNDANESGTVNSSLTTTDKNVDGPVGGTDGTEIPGNGTLSVKEDKGEDIKPAGSEIDNTEVSETSPVTFSIKEEGSRPVSAAELTKEEDSRSEVSIEDAVQVSEDRERSRPISALRAVEEIEKVTEEDTEVSKESAGSPLTKADEPEDDRIRLELPSTDATTVSSQATEGSRPVNFTESTKEGGTLQFSAADATKDVEISQEPTGSPPPSPNNIEAGESIPRNSAIDITENYKGTAGSRPASVTESTKDEERKSVDGTESAKKEGREAVNSGVSNAEVSENPTGSLPVSAIELTTDEGFQPTSAAEKITVVEETPVNITLSEKFEESRGSPLVQNEDSAESAPTQAISDTVEEEEVHPTRVEGPTEGAESRAVSVLEDAKNKGIESVTLENIKAPEDRSVSAANSTKEEVSRPVSAAVPTESTKRPASSIVEGVPVELGESKILASEGNRSESSTEITKDGNSTVTDVEPTEEVVVKSSVSTAEATTEEKGSRPLSGVNFMQEEGNRLRGVAGVVIEEGGRTASVSESIKEEGSRPVISELFSKEERIESAKEESIRPGTALNAKKEESRPDGPEESTTDENRLVGPSDSAKDQESRPSSIAADDSGPTETSQSRQDSVSGSVLEEGNVSPSDATGNVENPEEQTGTISISSELTNEGYRPTSSVPGKESSGENQTEAEVGNEDTEVAAESVEDFQASKRPEKQPSTEAVTVDIQEETENEKFIVEVDNSSTPPSALLSDGAKFEVSKEASEQGGLSSSPVTEKTESVAWYTDSAQARTDDIIPSLGTTVSGNEPGSDEETDVPVEDKPTKDEEKPATDDVDVDKPTKDEEKPATDDVDVDKPTKDESVELNTAATLIQSTFRGYQTRQALSKTTQKDEVPQSMTSHDFLFGPPVQQPAVSEETSVDRVAGSPETGEKQERENELAELQKPQECDEIRTTQDGPSDDVSDADSSLSTAATKIQAGVRGFLARRHVHNMKTSNSTTAPSIGESQQSLGDSLTSQEVEDEGVHTSGSLETEIQKQHQITVEDEIYQPQEEEFENEKTELQNRLSLDSQLEEKAQKPTVARSAVSLNLDRLGNEEEDRKVWETLHQQEMDDAATKIQSNYRGYRMRRSLKREDAIQMPTTSSSSTLTASSDVIPDPIRHSGEFHDMMVLPPSPEEDAADTSAQNHVVTAYSTPLLADDDVKSSAGNQETDVTEPSHVGVAKMDDIAESTAAEAATKIQSSYRGFKTRQDIKAANTAASKIQAGFRGYRVRKQLRENPVDNKNGPRSQCSRPQSTNQDTEANEVPASDIEERSATKIQASVRGYLVRKKRQTERNAALKIQAGFRGYQARREVKERRVQQQNN